jgi:hypothetical protein
VYYVFTPYIIVSLTIVVYTRSAAAVNIPYVNLMINFNAVSIHIAYTLTTFSWACHFKVKSTLTPKILILELGFISLLLITTLTSMLNFFSVLVR